MTVLSARTCLILARRSDPLVVALAQDGVEHLLLLLAVVDLLDARPETHNTVQWHFPRVSVNNIIHSGGGGGRREHGVVVPLSYYLVQQN